MLSLRLFYLHSTLTCSAKPNLEVELRPHCGTLSDTWLERIFLSGDFQCSQDDLLDKLTPDCIRACPVGLGNMTVKTLKHVVREPHAIGYFDCGFSSSTWLIISCSCVPLYPFLVPSLIPSCHSLQAYDISSSHCLAFLLPQPSFISYASYLGLPCTMRSHSGLLYRPVCCLCR